MLQKYSCFSLESLLLRTENRDARAFQNYKWKAGTLAMKYRTHIINRIVKDSFFWSAQIKYFQNNKVETSEHTTNIPVLQIMLIFINVINIYQYLALVQIPTRASSHNTAVKTLQDVFRRY